MVQQPLDPAGADAKLRPGVVRYQRQSDGGVAQLGERRVRNAKVRSSILLVSTKIRLAMHNF